MILSDQEYQMHKAAVWRATIILSVVTTVEVGIALLYDTFFHESGFRMALAVFMIMATMVKAYYIVAVFMHLKYERKALAITILMPIMFLIWLLIALLMEGVSWHQMIEFYG